MQPARRLTALLALVLLAADPLQASPPAFLVADLAEQPADSLYGPNEPPVVFQGVAYFAGGSSATGTELWRSDGSAAGTWLLKDLEPGAEGSYPYGFVECAGELYFATGYGAILALWKTDGTEAGTQRIKDFGFGDGYGILSELAVVGGTIYFAAYDTTHGGELWKSDGTAEGTLLVKDIAPGVGGSRPTWLTAHAGLLFFSATDGTNGFELWKSDGTPAGTVLVKDFQPDNPTGAPSSGLPSGLFSANGFLLFTADDGVHGAEPWRSDGTTAGTTLVKDVEIDFGSAPPDGHEFTELAGTIYFTAGGTLWRTDGTEAGTTPVYTAGYIYPFDLRVSNGSLYFAGSPQFSMAAQLWRSDGSAEGTQPVRDLTPGSWGSPPQLTDVDGTLFFKLHTPESGDEVWKSDGTEAGTVLVREIGPGSEGSHPISFSALGGTLLFAASEQDLMGLQLWKSDGSEAGTQRVLPQWPHGRSSEPYGLTDVDGTLFLAALDPGVDTTTSYLLWKTDGTHSGTERLSESGVLGIDPNNPAGAAAGLLFFRTHNGELGHELGISDGTPMGTQLLADVSPGSDSSAPSDFITLGDSVFFDSNDSGRRLWRSDGTASGTLEFEVPGVSLFAWGAKVMNGVMYLHGIDLAHGEELWRSDGTLAGTALVKDIVPGSGGFAAGELTPVNGTLFLVSRLPDGTSNLWKSDGTNASTLLVKSFTEQAESVEQLVNVAGTLFFTVVSSPSSYALWKSDGTPAGTILLHEFPNRLRAPTAAGGTLYLVTDDGVHGEELWKSDGTVAGTTLLKDVYPGSKHAFSPYGWPSNPLLDVNGTLFFVANDGVHGEEIWTSDGSAAGTHLLADVVPGSGGSLPGSLVLSGSLVYFAAFDDPTGREVYAVPATPQPAVITISGTAIGGSFEITTLSGVHVSIPTLGGQSAQAVAENLAAAIGADATAQAQGIFARVVGSSVIVVGTDAPNTASFTDDVGLGGAPPAVSAGGPAMTVALASLLLIAAHWRLRRSPR